MDNIKLLKELCDAKGVSGNDDEVKNIIIREIKPYCERLYVDKVGNLIAYKKGEKTPKNKMMFSAHTDEVGLMITGILDDGTLTFEPVGGIDSRVLSAKRVRVGELPGVICSKPIHCKTAEERKKATPYRELVIDIGANSKKQAQQYVKIGDTVTFFTEFAKFGENKIKAKALDDRLGCWLMCNLIKCETKYDAYFAFTQCEEVGCRGAMSAAAHIKPDIGVILETTTAADISGVSGDKRVCLQDGGAVLSIIDNGTVYDRNIYNAAVECAERSGIKWQTKTYVSGGNDSRAVQRAGNGAKVLAVSAPCRYLHTPSCVVDLRDAENMQELCLKLIEEYGDMEI
ncbi:MAG: M42 family metallopeptidase [Ruminococcaceae bacterium]|nr:M42 family metallopeptidase [Oscillospiraceae bacterium]